MPLAVNAVNVVRDCCNEIVVYRNAVCCNKSSLMISSSPNRRTVVYYFAPRPVRLLDVL